MFLIFVTLEIFYSSSIKNVRNFFYNHSQNTLKSRLRIISGSIDNI